MLFDQYNYERLPMGLKCSSDIAQVVMECTLASIEHADIYIDDVGAFSYNWNHHVLHLANILHHLNVNQFTINQLKCENSIKETHWLDSWLTPRGIKSWKKKITAILQWIAPSMPLNCTCSSDVFIATTTCGNVMPISQTINKSFWFEETSSNTMDK